MGMKWNGDEVGRGLGVKGRLWGAKRKTKGWGHKNFSVSKIAGELGESEQHYASIFIMSRYAYPYINVPLRILLRNI